LGFDMRIPQDDNYVTGKDYAARDGMKTHAEWLRRHAQKLVQRGAIDNMPTGKTRGSVKAYIDFERWIAACPDEYCGGHELVEIDEPIFFCLSCGNAANKGNYYAVEFPDAAKRVEIYAELEKRPLNRPPNGNKIRRAELSKSALDPRLSRSWHHSEKVNELKQQREFIERRGKPDGV